MKDFMGKLFNTIGFDYEKEDEEEEEVAQSRPQMRNVSAVAHHPNNQKRSKIVDINATTQFQVMVMVAEKYDDVTYISDHLKSKKPVIVNVERVDDNECQRIIDFLSGVTYAIGGEMQKISKEILLVTPNSVKIMGDFKTELLNGSNYNFLGKEF